MTGVRENSAAPEVVPERTRTLTRKVTTPFGSMYVHVEFDGAGRPCGGSISDPRKEPDAQVAKLVRALSEGLDDVLREASQDGRRP